MLNTRNGNMAINPGTKNYQPIPMEGVRVYAEWVDRGGYTSPTYTTVTGPDGRYAIKMKPFFDALGGEHTFDADPTLPEGEKIRVWAENPDGKIFQQVYGYNNGFLGPQANTIDTQGAATQWLIGSNRVNNVRFFYGERPQNEVMHKLNQAAENRPIAGQGGQVQGKAFWEQDHTQGAFTWNLMNTVNSGDVAATGLKIYGSYLSDYAINKIEKEAPKALGVDAVRKGTRSAWTRDNEAALQNWIKREMAKDTEKDPITGKFGKDRWIAETVVATVGADMNYTLQFNGTFGTGPGENDRGLPTNPLARTDGKEVTFPDGTRYVARDLKGTVAPSPEYATFSHAGSLNRADSMPKHVNWDWLFVSTEDVDGFGVQTPWQTNGYLDVGSYNTNDGWNVVKVGEHLNTAFISLYADYATFDVTPYDSAENWAKPGDVAETATSGLPTKFVNNLSYQIEWVNTETGGVVATSPVMSAGANGTLPSFPLNTGDVTKTTTFRADLYPIDTDENNARGSRIASDSFTVLVGWAPVYGDTEGVAGNPLKSGEPTFDNTATENVENTPGSGLETPVKSFEIPSTFAIPDGYEIAVDQASGEVTVTFPKDAAPGTTIEVPVLVTLQDNTKATGFADFKVREATDDADRYNPEGKTQYVPVNGTPDPKNNIQNVDDLPDGTTFTYKDGNPDTSTPGVKDVIVVVTYPDGSSEDVNAKINVTDPTKSNADNYQPETQNQDVPLNGTPDPKNNIQNVDDLPDGTTFTYKDGNPDTSTPGVKDVIVVVTYPDGSSEEVTSTVTVKSDADNNNPKGQNQTVPQGEQADPKKNIKNPDSLPNGTEFEYKTTPNTDKPGTQDVTVIVKYPDGSQDEVSTTVTVQAPTRDAQWDDASTTPDKPVEIEKTKDSGDFQPGSTVGVTNGSGTVKIDPDTGKITVTPSDDAKPGDKIVVTVKDPDGNVVDTVTVTVVDPDSWKDASTTPDKPVTIEKDPNSGDFTPGTTVEVEGPGKAEIDPNTGKITVTPSDDAKPGDKIVVTVKDPDGNVVDTVTVTVVDPDSWKDASTTPDKPVTIEKDPNSGDFTPGTTVEVEGPGKAEIDPNTGKITVTPSDDAKPGDKIVVTVKDPDGNVVDTVTVTVEKPKQSSSDKANELSSRKGCKESLIGFGVPLLLLVPLGIASQVAIPGLQDFQNQVGRQIQEANTALQRQLGIYDAGLSKAAADFDARLKSAGANASNVLAGLAVLAYGIAAITTIAVKCGPSNTETVTPKVKGEGSSVRQEEPKAAGLADGSSSKPANSEDVVKDENQASELNVDTQTDTDSAEVAEQQ